MYWNSRLFLFVISLGILFSSPIVALTVYVPFSDLVFESDSVVIGTVRSVESRWNEDQTMIRTYASVSVERYVTGEPVDSMITIVVDGGTVDGITLWVSDTPSFHPGMRSGFLLKKEESGMYTPYGQIQGVYALEDDPVTPIERFLDNLGLYHGYTANRFIRAVRSAKVADASYFDWIYPGWIISGWGMPDQECGKLRGCVITDGDFIKRLIVPLGNGVMI